MFSGQTVKSANVRRRTCVCVCERERVCESEGGIGQSESNVSPANMACIELANPPAV